MENLSGFEATKVNLFIDRVSEFVLLHHETSVGSHPSGNPGAHAKWIELAPDDQLPIDNYADFVFVLPQDLLNVVFRGSYPLIIEFSEIKPSHGDEIHDFLFFVDPKGRVEAHITKEEEESALVVEQLRSDQVNWLIGVVQDWIELNAPPGSKN